MDGADHPGAHFGGPARGIYFLFYYYFNPPEEEYQRAQREKRKLKKRRGKKARALPWPHPLPHQFVYLFIYLFSSSFTQWLAWTSTGLYFYCCCASLLVPAEGERERERGAATPSPPRRRRLHRWRSQPWLQRGEVLTLLFLPFAGRIMHAYAFLVSVDRVVAEAAVWGLWGSKFLLVFGDWF